MYDHLQYSASHHYIEALLCNPLIQKWVEETSTTRGMVLTEGKRVAGKALIYKQEESYRVVEFLQKLV